MIGAENVDVWADIKKKHASHAITSDIGPGVTAEAAEFMKADAVIVTGGTTGSPPLGSDIEDVRAHCHLPLILGSGVDIENIVNFHSAADGFIIGSSFKRDGHWANPIEAQRVKRFMEKIGELSESG
jgi:predicted TIM-barrel enzyme